MGQTPTENAEQAALFNGLNWHRGWGHIPELRIASYSIPNGGLRDARTAVTLQRTGVKPGGT